MEYDLAKAYKKLCELDLNFTYDGLNINVLWFRAMINMGDWKIERHMERKLNQLLIAQSGFEFEIKPYEIKTFRIVFKNYQNSYKNKTICTINAKTIDYL